MDEYIKRLKGYQNINPDLKSEGVVIDYGGKTYDLFDFDAKLLSIEDTARQLSRINRYNGNTNKAYSVAQHSVMGAQSLLLIGMVQEAKIFLHHDDSECITNDINPIIKKALGDAWSKIEDDIQAKISKKFGIQFPFPNIIHIMDKNIAQFELSMMIKSRHSNEFDYWDEEKSFKQYLWMFKTIDEMLLYQT